MVQGQLQITGLDKCYFICFIAVTQPLTVIENLYQPQGLEKWGDKVISTAHTIMNIGLYTSPFICMYVYKRGFYTIEEMRSYGRFFGGIGCLIALSFLLRAYGRTCSTKYMQFLNAIQSPMTDTKTYLDNIRKYDFEFNAWPVTFSLPVKEKSWSIQHPFRRCANDQLPLYQRASLQVLAFIATHTFALRLIYPGSLGLIQNLLFAPLFQGRTQLVEAYNGQRSKVGTTDGNAIDTMFVDNRPYSAKGNTLMVCCEGNSGFYEIGIMSTPVKAGYSALGWNHPGFAGSTGLPYPSQEHNAIDAVMQYAINELGFQAEDIVLFGWSIGGYSATWAAVQYATKALVLDATFDDLLPLAENQMPSSWSLLVKEVVRSYVDLNVAELVKQYNGPVQLVRRTEDEIICLRQGQLSSNRGNHLLIKLIRHRHPQLTEDSAVISSLAKLLSLLEPQRAAIDRSAIDDHEKKLLPLISKYMRDYKSTHCTPLPEEHFQTIMDNIDTKKKE